MLSEIVQGFDIAFKAVGVVALAKYLYKKDAAVINSVYKDLDGLSGGELSKAASLVKTQVSADQSKVEEAVKQVETEVTTEVKAVEGKATEVEAEIKKL